MFKPKQPQSNNNQPPSRQRLPLVDRAPRQEDIAALFTGAMRIKGCSFELPVQPTIHSKIYLVTCQFDNFTNETVWSMYEGEQGSLQLWTCPHSDLDLVFDMVCMSAGTNKGANSMPAEVAQPATPPPQPAPVQQYPPPNPAPQAYPPPGQYSSPHQVYPPQPQPQPYSQPYPATPQQYPPQPQTPYTTPYPPAQPYPPQQNPYPQQQQPYPQPGPAQPYPNPDWPQPQPQQQPFYQQPSANPAWTGQPAQQPFQAPPYTPASPAPAPAPSTSSHSVPLVTPELTNFIDLINKGTPNLLLGHLFVEAGIVPEKCLDAALKCQELVRVGKLSNEQAVLALKRAAELGGILDDDVVAWARDPEGARAKSRASANRGNAPEEPAYTPPYTSAFEPNKPIQAAPAKPATGVSRDVSAMQKVIELLKQAGLVSEADVETARKVRSKHGGDLGQILVSAGKVGAQTMEAASRCQELVTNGRLRIDKAIAALHYCERMRAGLDDALDELHIELL
ncbi:MAG: hypothetical protein K2W95_21480 [Candidatus Obscuribacterales bacterium]|nr:hypothetical protein [Candidatus Obscuribacterales bacterium]